MSYQQMLHTYETLGWWRRSLQSKRVHFAEEYNEYHHLLIMESLGGDQEWQVRFFAQHASIVYYFVLLGLWYTTTESILLLIMIKKCTCRLG